MLGREQELLYASCHQYEVFPGTGGDDDFFPGTGAEHDAGGIFNVQLAPAWSEAGSCGERFRNAVGRICERVERFGPSLVIVSAGFDGAAGDEGNTVEGKAGSDLSPGD